MTRTDSARWSDVMTDHEPDENQSRHQRGRAYALSVPKISSMELTGARGA
jgi:hypothetical protein